ncbi:hypothetical protein [Dyadobacter sp. CY326]|uniref:hypothetical protein n=1 Tax=Dyadobacter sp. CY326 TaxID=2907300 RepID=UPI001F279567|nr:hypothetical protein [Dyadobacter sp. CY326]MCE7065802.1 hypothetical protein [Dyadobacter sp. CY326]
MLNTSEALIAEITDFEIHVIDDVTLEETVGSVALSASIEIKINENYYVFGGPTAFLSIPNQGVDFFGHFVMRCMQAVGVTNTRDMEGELVKVIISDAKVVAISSLRNDAFFSPFTEFALIDEKFTRNK